jgi:hypothetical protein
MLIFGVIINVGLQGKMLTNITFWDFINILNLRSFFFGKGKVQSFGRRWGFGTLRGRFGNFGAFQRVGLGSVCGRRKSVLGVGGYSVGRS